MCLKWFGGIILIIHNFLIFCLFVFSMWQSYCSLIGKTKLFALVGGDDSYKLLDLHARAY